MSEELQIMQKEGAITPVRPSDWAAPTVPVLKQDGPVRICSCFQVTINPNTVEEKYSVPRVEDLCARLPGGQKFTRLDLKDSYQQVELEVESQKLVTISTQQGLFQYTRLHFGVSPAPAIFQREMENLLRDMHHVAGHIDDILVTAQIDNDHGKDVRVFYKVSRTQGSN